jgi:hypothetical protein
MPFVHQFVFFQRPRAGQDPRIGWHVDATALSNVSGALQPQGYSIGDIYLNYPPRRNGSSALEVPQGRFAPGDLIMSATRFELKPKIKCRKVVMMTRAGIEPRMSAAWSEAIQSSQRLMIVVNDEVARWFKPGFETRNNIEFNEREGAFYTGLACAKTSVRATAAYLLRKNELWPGGPGYLGFFGMDSTITLAWSHLLRHRHADLLQTEGFFVAELAGKLPGRVSNLDWALDWRSEIILRAPGGLAPNISSAQNPTERPAA